MPSTCPESCNHWCHVRNHSNWSHRNYYSNLGIQSGASHQPHLRWFPQCCGYNLYPRYQDPGFWPAHCILWTTSKGVWHSTPLAIPLQNNTRWGTAEGMLGWSHQLCQVCFDWSHFNHDSCIHSRQSICSLTQLMSYSVQSPLSIALGSHPKKSHGWHSGLIPRIGNM